MVAFAPGRVNLIGEHTDYNEGFVLPAAIDRGVAVAARRAPGDTFTLHALDLGERCTFSRVRLERDPAHPWADYFKGVVWALTIAGIEAPACEAAVTGDLPRGAGLSSSAAYEVAALVALRALGGLALAVARRGQAGPRGRERLRGRGLRDHGPDGLHVRRRGPRAAARLPVAGAPDGGDPAGPEDRRRQQRRPPRPRLVGVQQAPRRVRGGRSDPVVAARRPAFVARRRARRRGALLPEAAARRAQAMPPRRLRERPRARNGEGAARRRHGQAQDAARGVARQPARRLRGELPRARRPGRPGARPTPPATAPASPAPASAAAPSTWSTPRAVASFSDAVAAGYRARTGRTPEIYVFEPSPGARIV